MKVYLHRKIFCLFFLFSFITTSVIVISNVSSVHKSLKLLIDSLVRIKELSISSMIYIAD